MRLPSLALHGSIVSFAFVAMVACDSPRPSGPGAASTHEHAEEAEGPHGGRLLGDGSLLVEAAIVETGTAPRLRLWVSRDGHAVEARRATARGTLQRLAEAPLPLAFSPSGEFLAGDAVLKEPHSFRVELEVTVDGDTLRTGWEQVESRVTISAESAKAGGVDHARAGAHDLERTLRLTGRIAIRPERLATLGPRFDGRVVEARFQAGDRVAAGDVLAVVEASGTLARLPLASPLAGVVLDRSAVAGTITSSDDVLYVVADLGEVQADFDVYGSDAPYVRMGDLLTVEDDARGVAAEARVAYVSPLRDLHTQTTLVRAYLDNGQGRWSPGAFVSARVRLVEQEAAVAVPTSALQTWQGREAVFVHAEGAWEPRAVLVGRRGELWLEVLEGLEAGVEVAVGNTFLLRAELEKAGASHDH